MTKAFQAIDITSVTTIAELRQLTDDYGRLLRNSNVDSERVAVLDAGIKSFLWWAQDQLKQRSNQA